MRCFIDVFDEFLSHSLPVTFFCPIPLSLVLFLFPTSPSSTFMSWGIFFCLLGQLVLEIFYGLGVPDDFYESCLLEHGHLSSGQNSEEKCFSFPQQTRFVERGVAS